VSARAFGLHRYCGTFYGISLPAATWRGAAALAATGAAAAVAVIAAIGLGGRGVSSEQK
jgi:uncharacterized membrane protein